MAASLTIGSLAFNMFLFATLLASPLEAFAQSTAAHGPQQTYSLREYISALDQCSAVLNGSAIDPAAVHALRVGLPEEWTVSTGDTRYQVPTDWLADSLAIIEKNPRASNDALLRARQRLQMYREQAQALESQSPQNLAPARAGLNEIMSAREFRGQQGPSWLDVLKERFWSWVMRQLERIFGRFSVSKPIGDIVAWIVITLAALLLLFWTVRFLMRVGGRTDMDLSGATPINRDWHRWLREAREAAAKGDYRAAIHAGYWAAIVRMEETKALPEDRSRTPRESLRLVRRESADYAPLSQLTRRFELVWYGYRSATAADWSDAMQQLEILGCLRSSTPAISAS